MSVHEIHWEIPKSHPRYASLKRRERLVECVSAGIVTLQGLIAHGRGEAFDYLIGERTLNAARRATEVAAELLLSARKPVISVNGNVAALAPRAVVELASLTNALIEVNLFHRTEERVRRIKGLLERKGARGVLGEHATERIEGLEHPRGLVEREGIFTADVVLVAIEDGDRTEALVKMGKKVIAIDLNPLSRTARTATVTIVDDVERALKNLASEVSRIKAQAQKAETEKREKHVSSLNEILSGYDNKEVLREVLREITRRLHRLASCEGERGSAL
ncbi:MAG: 4-phosphopantoate--beta-alanine ligase [Candidatus Methanospirare jalkutatii]|nr:4-phosphopantoate--beta-alanine ligase [Candidatus Methanospirare jalkutatii]